LTDERPPEPIEREGHVGVLKSKHLLDHGDRPAVQGGGFRVAPKVGERIAELVEHPSQLQVSRVRFLEERDGAAMELRRRFG
jgi:hypothetical protein